MTPLLRSRIDDWRAGHPNERLALGVVLKLNGGASLRGADFRGASLRWANLTGANFTGADLTGADLTKANLIGANLRGADLIGANLTGADLIGANLRGADLIRADLTGADLTGADLTRANLTGADLQWANIISARLTWAYLAGADLAKADLRGLTFSAGPSGDGWLVRLDADGRATRGPEGIWLVSIGCWRDKTLDDLRDLIEDRVEWPEATGEERERRRPYLRAVLALCEAHIAYEASVDADSVVE